MYQALYRKWRPKTFDEVYGQQHITDILKKQVLLGKLSHAYLFTGTRGTGKTTCAKLLARAVNCENPVGGNPCGVCPSCVGIENGSILDVTEMDAASNNGVENVRALREEAIYSPSAVKACLYSGRGSHVSSSAFNTLKILEEPPEHLIFILAPRSFAGSGSDTPVPALFLQAYTTGSDKQAAQRNSGCRRYDTDRRGGAAACTPGRRFLQRCHITAGPVLR